MTANDLTFGVEIECCIPACNAPQVGGYHCGTQIAALPAGWNAQRDSSIHAARGCVGVEVVSPVLKGREGLEQLKVACEWLRRVGARVNRSTGLHVHVGYDRTDAAAVKKIVSVVANFEKAIYASTGTKSREAGHFCQSVQNSQAHRVGQIGRIVDHLGLLAMAADARMLIGHCRYATHGAPENNLNNHPHPADGGWIVHNGVISGYDGIVGRNDLHPVTECDSEALGLLIEQGRGTLQERCVQAVQEAGENPLVMLGLWSRPGRLVALRNGNPLSLGICNDGDRVYLASLQEGLPGEVMAVPARGGVDFTATGWRSLDIPEEAQRVF